MPILPKASRDRLFASSSSHRDTPPPVPSRSNDPSSSAGPSTSYAPFPSSPVNDPAPPLDDPDDYTPRPGEKDMDSWRLCLVGDGGVGKTALAVQFTLHAFVMTYDPTIEDAYRKTTRVTGQRSFIEIIDTAGQEEYSTIRDQWLWESSAFVLVFSLASYRSLDRLRLFFATVMRVKRFKPILILVGNKLDQKRVVSQSDAVDFAREIGATYIETSAKTAHNVAAMFTEPIARLRAKHAHVPPEIEVKGRLALPNNPQSTEAPLSAIAAVASQLEARALAGPSGTTAPSQNLPTPVEPPPTAPGASGGRNSTSTPHTGPPLGPAGAVWTAPMPRNKLMDGGPGWGDSDDEEYGMAGPGPSAHAQTHGYYDDRNTSSSRHHQGGGGGGGGGSSSRGNGGANGHGYGSGYGHGPGSVPPLHVGGDRGGAGAGASSSSTNARPAGRSRSGTNASIPPSHPHYPPSAWSPASGPPSASSSGQGPTLSHSQSHAQLGSGSRGFTLSPGGGSGSGAGGGAPFRLPPNLQGLSTRDPMYAHYASQHSPSGAREISAFDDEDHRSPHPSASNSNGNSNSNSKRGKDKDSTPKLGGKKRSGFFGTGSSGSEKHARAEKKGKSGKKKDGGGGGCVVM